MNLLKLLTPSAVVIAALAVSAGLVLATGGQINWKELPTNAITYYFVYLRGKNDDS